MIKIPTPRIDSKKCDLCSTCVDICPVQVFETKEKEIVVAKPEECLGCKACEVQCPKEAIKVKDD